MKSNQFLQRLFLQPTTYLKVRFYSKTRHRKRKRVRRTNEETLLRTSNPLLFLVLLALVNPLWFIDSSQSKTLGSITKINLSTASHTRQRGKLKMRLLASTIISCQRTNSTIWNKVKNSLSTNRLMETASARQKNTCSKLLKVEKSQF